MAIGTKTEKLIEAIKLAGGREEPWPTIRKYRAFRINKSESIYFVGKAAALRHGRCVSDSYSIEPTRNALLTRYDRLGEIYWFLRMMGFEPEPRP